MVKKIRKRIKRRSGGPQAVPLVMPLVCLYGLRLQGKEFRNRFENPGKVREVYQAHLGVPVVIGDRPLSLAEYRGSNLIFSPARAAVHSSSSGVAMLGAPSGSPVEGRPVLGLIPVVAVVEETTREGFMDRSRAEFSEVLRVAFQNSVAPGFHLIPGYDRLIYLPPVHAGRINEAISVINERMREEFDAAGVEFPGPFAAVEERFLSSIPFSESLMETGRGPI